MRSKALAAGARQWLRDLPVLIAALEREWSITVGRPYADPTEAFVAEAVLGDGTATGLLATRIGLEPVGRQMLAAADHVASQPR